MAMSSPPPPFLRIICPEPIISNMAPEYSRVCFTKNSGGVPGEEPIDTYKAIINAISVNPRNSTLNTLPGGSSLGSITTDHGPLQLAITTRKLWKSGSKLKVQFKGGSPWQHEKVKAYAPLWSSFANIKFEFDASSSPDILISFVPALGSWSLLGTDSTYATDQGRPSMNFGWIHDSKPEADIRQVVLHEFGHALGAVHEHTSPFATIPWNKENVYNDLGRGPNFWSREEVDRNMFTVFDAVEVPSTEFDPFSIMLYQYPGSWTTDGKGTSYNTELSDKDKAFISFCYPKDEYDVSLFHTLQKQKQGLLGPTTEAIFYFYKGFASSPRLVCGLYWLDIERGADAHIRAVTKNIQRDHFTAALETWGETKLRAAGMTWLEVPRFPFLQTGVFSTEEVRPWNQPRAKTSKRIDFDAPFLNSPQVVCFFTSLDMADGHDWRAEVFPSEIDVKGFTINVSTWSNTILYSSGVAWLAHPSSNQTKVASGRFSAADNASSNEPQTSSSMVKEWGVQFERIPKVFIALDKVDYEYERDIKCRLSLSSVTPTEMTWNLEAWGDSVTHSSGASYFAWEEAQ